MYVNKVIEEAYSLEVIGYIKVSKKVYKVKCKEGFFCLKFVEDNNLSVVLDHIESLHLKCFLPVIKNSHHQILTTCDDKIFYLSPWLVNDNAIIKELKLKFYYECLAYLHSSSFFNYSVSKSF